MSGGTPVRNVSQQRPPLHFRDPPLDENCSESTLSSYETSSAPNNTNIYCKRLNPEVLSINENEPIAYCAKRQRVKSGTGLMDVTAENSINLNLLKDELNPLGERNFQTHNKSHVPVASSLKNSDQLTTSNNVSESPLKLTCKKNKGDMSPHCAATLEYVTKLPEGCSTEAENLCLPSEVANDSDDDELEDDDNYLDSSDSDNEDLDNCNITDNEDDQSCCEDDQSIISTVTVGSTSSLRSVTSETINSIYMNENGVASNEDGTLLYNNCPAINPLNSLNISLFSNVPPTINFCKYNETTSKLPEEISKHLKWKFTAITPLIVKKTLLNSGFKINKKTCMWVGIWGKHMKSPLFKGIKEYQKVNHFPGTFQIGRKDKLWKNFAKLQIRYGKEAFGFIPKTFVLPGDLKALKVAFEKEGVKKKWIIKPPASARGTGIQVVNKWSQLPVDTPVVVQRYISRPFLINNTKFDIRIYVLITSFDPLRVFLYEDGLVRFASVQYQKNSKTLSDRFMHLTNYSVNKTSTSYTHNDDAGHCQGHKWTLKTLWGYLKAQGTDTGELWSLIVDLVIKTILAGEQDVVLRTRKSTKSLYNCYELFGFDVILDEKLRPWLLEVNISPSLHSASSLDHSVKGPLISDLLNLVGFHIPDKITETQQKELLKQLNLDNRVNGLCLDRRLYTRMITLEEQTKHLKMNPLSRSQYLTAILDNLQPDDVRQLIIAEDQLTKAGKFACIFPTTETYNYFGFLDKSRYYNKLLDAWENSYAHQREKGLQILEDLCKQNLHLKVTPRFKLPKKTCLDTAKVISTQLKAIPKPNVKPIPKPLE